MGLHLSGLYSRYSWRPVASDGHSVGAPVVLNVDV